jgi:hypothetical protein
MLYHFQLGSIICSAQGSQFITGNPQDPVDWYQATNLNLVLCTRSA